MKRLFKSPSWSSDLAQCGASMKKTSSDRLSASPHNRSGSGLPTASGNGACLFFPSHISLSTEKEPGCGGTDCENDDLKYCKHLKEVLFCWRKCGRDLATALGSTSLRLSNPPRPVHRHRPSAHKNSSLRLKIFVR